MNGRQQVEAMAALCKPDQLGGWRVGDVGRIPGVGFVEVVALRPPSELDVRVESGATCRVGYRLVSRNGPNG